MLIQRIIWTIIFIFAQLSLVFGMSNISLQDFKLWKTQNLKDYLKERGYPCSKRREASTQLHITTAYELKRMKSALVLYVFDRPCMSLNKHSKFSYFTYKILLQELEALCYAASIMNTPKTTSMEDEKRLRAKHYYDLLSTPQGHMPDPFDLNGWLNENEGKYKWPSVFKSDIDAYLSK